MKESIALLYEGDIDTLKNQNGPIKLFWDLYEKVKLFRTFSKASGHQIIAHSVDIRDENSISELLANIPYFSKNPFGKLDDFACVYEFTRDEIFYKVNFGNYTQRDIKKNELMPFRTEFNKDLIGTVGIMGKVEILEKEKNITFNKFKSLLVKVEETFKSLDI